ncbi:MAG: hypothetical protein ABSC46_01375 [Candidatus Limnocylindrales bacterium]|jgi:hypothetical protein
MKHSLLRLIALTAALALLLAGCGTSGTTEVPTMAPGVAVTVAPATPTSAPTPTTAPSPSNAPVASQAPSGLGLSGPWNGTWQDTSPDTSSGTFAVTFTQTGNNLSGTITVKGTPCLTSGAVTGTITGGTISFGAVSGNVTITYDGSVSGSKMQGTYAAPACGNAKGNWSATQS